MVRHVSISGKDLLGEEQIPHFLFKLTKLWTFLIPEHSKINQRFVRMNQRFVKTCISRFKYLRVLDLGGSPLEELPSSICSLFHLRFLNLSYNDKIKRLPNSICKLLNLESLTLFQCTALEEIPKDIGNLIKLRSLVITTRQKCLPKGICRLTLLEILEFYNCVNLKSLGEEIQFLTNLCQLMLFRCENLESLPPNMKLLAALNNLAIIECKKHDLMKTKEGPQALRSFMISSDLEALPPWLEDSAKFLQSMIVVECENLTRFPELQKFTFLEQLVVERCPNLLALPQGLHCLTELKELRINGCPELSKRCKRQFKAEEWSKFVREAKIELDSYVEEENEDAFNNHNAISTDN